MLSTNTLNIPTQGHVVSQTIPRFSSTNDEKLNENNPIKIKAPNQQQIDPANQRGDLTQELCLTIELSEVKTSAAIWDEENSQTIHLNIFHNDDYSISLPSSLSISEEENYKALKDHVTSTDKVGKLNTNKVLMGNSESLSKYSISVVPLLG